MVEYSAIVLAGGSAERLGGVDKCMIEVGGHAVLGRVIACVADATAIVVVGPRRELDSGLRWTREDPPGAGPMAGVSAGLRVLADIEGDYVVVLAGDHPFLGDLPQRLNRAVAADPGAHVAVAVDPNGRDQYLCAAWRRHTLDSVVQASNAAHLRRARDLFVGQRVVRVQASVAESLDCDSPEDVELANVLARASTI